MKFTVSKTTGSILLVAGTQIGAGMLALPFVTGVAGFWPSIALFITVFVYMLASLFLLVEVNLWSHKVSANIITLAKEHLGKWGQATAWVCFLLLLYSVAAAYLSGGGDLLASALRAGLPVQLSSNIGVGLFLVLFGVVVVFGTRILEGCNRFFAVGLLIAFLALIIFSVPRVSAEGFSYGRPIYLMAALPAVVLSFTSHIIVPSLRTYFAGDHPNLLKALFWGSVLPLVCYIVWECIIIGVLPGEGPQSLFEIARAERPISELTRALNTLLGFPAVAIVVGFFSFFALVTSFLGVSLALFDFLADGLAVKKTPVMKGGLLCLMYLPPLIFALFYPRGFVMAVSYAGVFVAILYAILPVLMVWKGRYIEKQRGDFRVPGGKVVPIIVFIGGFVIIVFQIAAVNGYLPALQ